MIATSWHDVYTPSEYPGCFFSKRYRGKHFVAYNLKYDGGAFVQHLPISKLKQLQKTDNTIYKGYNYKIVINKNFFHFSEVSIYFL